MSKAQEKRWDVGEQLYDTFVERLRAVYMFDEPVSSPSTKRLEIFANLDRKGEAYSALLVAEMCREFQSNFKDGLFADGREVYERVETSHII